MSKERVYQWMDERSREVSCSTVNRDLTALKRLFGWLAEIGFTETHLLSGVKPFKEPVLKRPLLSYQEYLKLIAEAGRVPHSKPLVLVAFVVIVGETGCRKSEALHLRWDECDFGKRTVAFNTVKGRRCRIVPMSPLLDYALQGLRLGDSPHVLTNPLTKERLVDPKNGFATAAANAGVPWLQIHDMRRFRACQWAVNGVTVPAIQKLLGHRSVETTMRYLQHLDPDFDAVRAASKAEISGFAVGDIWETAREQGMESKGKIGVNR